MGIFTSASNAICSILNTASDIGEATGKTVSIATTYVETNASKLEREIKRDAAMSEAKNALTHRQELQSDADLAAIYEELTKEFYT